MFMSAPRIKKKKSVGDSVKTKGGPLDWIRTDDRSMEECFYILLMTRGLYPVLEALGAALETEADASITQKIQFHPGWGKNAEFCTRAVKLLRDMSTDLQQRYVSDDPEEVPNTARRKQPTIGGLYPLPGGGIYIPKNH
jgi:hypothetical protein